MDLLLNLLTGGAGNLAAYLAAHVLLCLLPAFFIAGAMSALIPKPAITRWLGRNTSPAIAYPAAAAAGSLLAVCSCTIVPLFAGIHRKGAGLGPAITFLFFAPAGNVLALSYTGTILGAEFALARFVLCLLFGIGIGLLMALIFWRDDADHDAQTDGLFAGQTSLGVAAGGVLLSMLALLLAGTLKLAPLSRRRWRRSASRCRGPRRGRRNCSTWVPFDAAKGEEGVSVQGSLLIALLVLIGVSAWKGLENITEGANRWTWTALALAAVTLLVATLRLVPQRGRPGRGTHRARRRRRRGDGRLAALRAQAAGGRLARLAVGNVALRPADLPAARDRRVRRRRDPATDPARVDPGARRPQRRRRQRDGGRRSACSCTSRRWSRCRSPACSSTSGCTRGRCWPT